MTDEQIIEALKITSEDIVCAVVDENNNTHFVTNQNVLVLIEQQRANIEKLINECGSQSVLWRDNFASVYETAKETIKAEARTEAIREFAERVKEYYSQSKYLSTKEHPVRHTMIDYLFRVVDQIARQMTEEQI